MCYPFEDYDVMAEQMLKKIENINEKYPETVVAVDNLQDKLFKCMQNLHKKFSALPDKDKKIFTLLVINEIHRIIDKVFQIV